MSSPDKTRVPSVFIGSSSEASEVVRYLQSELNSTGRCTTTAWNQGVFAAGSYTLESLVEAARRADFAVLVATPDDVVNSRDLAQFAPRDNVILELGLFLGALGRERTYVVADRTAPLKLPSDMAGITFLSYSRPAEGNWRGALVDVVLGLSERLKTLGPRTDIQRTARFVDTNIHALDAELGLLVNAAVAQGWRVKQTATALRLTREPDPLFRTPELRR